MCDESPVSSEWESDSLGFSPDGARSIFSAGGRSIPPPHLFNVTREGVVVDYC